MSNKGHFEIGLLPYDDRRVELGFTPWPSLVEFMDENGVTTVKLKVLKSLHQANGIALDRFRNPHIAEQEFERPFMFGSDSLEPYEGEQPPDHSTAVDIALDALHGFIAARAFQSYVYGYRIIVGEKTQNVITGFVNRYVGLANLRD